MKLDEFREKAIEGLKKTDIWNQAVWDKITGARREILTGKSAQGQQQIKKRSARYKAGYALLKTENRRTI
jgi:hypothetical protein